MRYVLIYLIGKGLNRVPFQAIIEFCKQALGIRKNICTFAAETNKKQIINNEENAIT